MALVNEHYLKLPGSYLFIDVAKRVNVYKAQHPQTRVISLGIGDVTQPLCPAVIEAMHKAVDEMAVKASFRGYGPEHGYDFLRWDNSVAVTDPVYPVYIDSNAMIGRAGVFADGRWTDITYLPCTAENEFIPQLPDHRVDMIYLCYPNNPTGTVLRKEELRKWVNFALKNDAVLFYDAAYEAYIQDPDIPHSIYEIKGARKCAIEFHSYSKTAGFTGVRCGYTVIPKEVCTTSLDGTQRVPLYKLWERRQSTKFNGTSYISQRAAEAIYTPEGHEQIMKTIHYYMENARIMRETLTKLGFRVYGGENAPYLWVKTPGEEDSWKFFDRLLYGCGVVCTPGVGFGPSGEGYFRLTSFGNREDVEEAMQRIAEWMKKQ